MVVLKLSEAIENELLHLFELTFTDLVTPSPKDKAKLLSYCQNLVRWLHFFNNGLSVQKKYIFTVVSQRIPVNLVNNNTVSVSTWKKIATTFSKINRLVDNQVNDDDDSSVGAASDDEVESIATTAVAANPSTVNNNTANVTDQLSDLFGTISAVCQEQFTVIRLVFPAATVARITRLLIQRIFNDPLFGIQIRVDAVLSPRPPKPPLSLGEYIEALILVRQKLSSLYILLLEYCIHPEDMGLEAELKDSATVSQSTQLQTNGRSNENEAGDAADPAVQNLKSLLEDEDERAKAEADVKDFLEEQIAQVLTTYINDYFDNKELLYLKQQFVDNLRRAVDSGNQSGYNSNTILSKIQYATSNNAKSSSAVSSGTILTLPKLKAEKMKSIEAIVVTVANIKYFSSVFNNVLDSLYRVTVIERDERKLAIYFKEIFLTLLGFLIDGLLVPISQSATIILLKFSSSSSNLSTPPADYLDLLSIVYWCVNKLNAFFTDSFITILSSTSKELSKSSIISQNAMNTITICKESKRRYLKILEKVARESLHAWTLCIGLFVDKTLLNTQIKNDYNPKAFDPSLAGAAHAASTVANAATTAATTAANKVAALASHKDAAMRSSADEKVLSVDPTTACDLICRALIEVATEIRVHSDEIAGINLFENFWVPLGRQIIGSIISHLKRQKISPDGAKVVIRDLTEYYNVSYNL
jgi:hypothetical protein